MIGNSLADDIEGALAAGMAAVLLDRSGTAPADPRYSVVDTLDRIQLMR